MWAVRYLRHSTQFHITSACRAGSGEKLLTVPADRKPPLILLLRHPVSSLYSIAVFFNHFCL